MGWLDRSVDPLDGLEIGRATILQGATTHYVDQRLRPETRQVLAMARAADLLCGDEGTDQEEERQRRAQLTAREPDTTLT